MMREAAIGQSVGPLPVEVTLEYKYISSMVIEFRIVVQLGWQPYNVAIDYGDGFIDNFPDVGTNVVYAQHAYATRDVFTAVAIVLDGAGNQATSNQVLIDTTSLIAPPTLDAERVMGRTVAFFLTIIEGTFPITGRLYFGDGADYAFTVTTKTAYLISHYYPAEAVYTSYAIITDAQGRTVRSNDARVDTRPVIPPPPPPGCGPDYPGAICVLPNNKPRVGEQVTIWYNTTLQCKAARIEVIRYPSCESSMYPIITRIDVSCRATPQSLTWTPPEKGRYQVVLYVYASDRQGVPMWDSVGQVELFVGMEIGTPLRTTLKIWPPTAALRVGNFLIFCAVDDLMGGSPDTPVTITGDPPPYDYVFEFFYGDGTREIDWVGLGLPIHAYSQPGRYEAFARVVDGRAFTIAENPLTNPNLYFETNHIFLDITGVGTSPLTVSLSSDKASAPLGQPTSFTAQASGGLQPYEYIWDFGDGHGGPTTYQNQTAYTYDKSGTYSARVSVRDASLAIVTSNAVTITITGTTPSLAVQLTAAPTVAQVGATVGFTALASGGVVPYVTYAWDFGDGHTDITPSPLVSYRYTQAGSYQARVTATDATGHVAISAPVAVSIRLEPPIGLFSAILHAAKTTVTVGEEVLLAVSVDGGTPPYQYQWRIDGAFGPLTEIPSLVTSFTVPGSHQVAVVVTGSGADIAESNTVVITVKPGPDGITERRGLIYLLLAAGIGLTALAISKRKE